MEGFKGLMVNRCLHTGIPGHWQGWWQVLCGSAAVLAMLTLGGCANLPTPQTAASGAGTPPSTSSMWQGWRLHLLPGKRPTHYHIDQHEGRSVVLATSERAVSLFRKNERIEPDQLGALQFSWKVPQLISGADLAQRDKADSPARLVLAFEGDRSTFSMKNSMLSELSLALTGEPMPYATLMYVWSNAETVGAVLKDPNTDRIRKLVVASGPSQLNQWLHVERDVARDFVKAFGEAPGALLSMALMTDTDNTGSMAKAYYGPVAWVKP